jgi:hypothetical protein
MVFFGARLAIKPRGFPIEIHANKRVAHVQSAQGNACPAKENYGSRI